MGFCFTLFLPLSLIPAGGHSIGGQEVTFTEFWQCGGGPTFFIAGIRFPLTSYGFLRARNWSRYVYVGMHLPMIVWTLVCFALLNGLLVIGWTAFATYYLFFRQDVREYFGIAERAGS